MFRARRLLAAGLMLGAGLVAGPLLPRSAHAEIDLCRTDPVISLSNGATISVATTINTSAANVASAAFIVYVPTGVTETNEDTSDLSLPNEAAMVLREGRGRQWDPQVVDAFLRSISDRLESPVALLHVVSSDEDQAPSASA